MTADEIESLKAQRDTLAAQISNMVGIQQASKLAGARLLTELVAKVSDIKAKLDASLDITADVALLDARARAELTRSEAGLPPGEDPE